MMPSTSYGQDPMQSANNPLGMTGISWAEFFSQDPEILQNILDSLGFMPIARHTHKNILMYEQGSIQIILNGEVDINMPKATSCSGMGFRVTDSKDAFLSAIDRGGLPLHSTKLHYGVPTFLGKEEMTIYLVDAKTTLLDNFESLCLQSKFSPLLTSIQSITFYLKKEMRLTTIEYYQKLFGFGRIDDANTLQSPCKKILFKFKEGGPSEDIQTSQWITFLTPHLKKVIKALQEKAVSFSKENSRIQSIYIPVPSSNLIFQVQQII